MKDWIMNFMKAHREGILYIVCGGGTCAVTWLSYMLFVWLGIDLNVSNIASWICGVTFAFIVNKWIVFLSHSTKGRVVIKELGSFFAARIFTGILAAVLFPILINIGLDQSFLGTEGMIAKLTVSVIEIVINYALSKWYIFKKTSDVSNQ